MGMRNSPPKDMDRKRVHGGGVEREGGFVLQNSNNRFPVLGGEGGSGTRTGKHNRI